MPVVEVKMGSEVAKDVIAGTVGGAAQIMCGHPFDTIKVKLQTQKKIGGPSGAMGTLRSTLKQDGVGGLYRGMAAPLATVAAMNAVLFTARGQMEVLLELVRGKGGASVPLTVSDQMICGAGGGAVMSLLACPTELIKCRLQAAKRRKKIMMGSFDVAQQVIRKEGGFVGLFKGLNATLCREVPGNAIMFGTYHALKNWMAVDRSGFSEQGKGAMLMAGAMAGVVPCVLIYPVDVVKSVIQVDRFHNPRYSETVDAFRKIFASEGFKGFYKGFYPALIRSVPATSTCFLAYEFTRASFT